MPATLPPLPRLLSSFRIREIAPLQGSPLVGAVLAAGTVDASFFWPAVILMAGSCCLVAHVFLFNDWAGIDGDLRSAPRASQTFVAKGISRAAVAMLATVALVVALSLCALLGPAPFVIALSIAIASALYSSPWTHLKGSPLAGTLLHLLGGSLHFLLGYATFAPVDGSGVITSLFFGLVFAAGHLMHETRDHDADLANGIRTNAVAFGRRWAFLAGLALFGAAYALLVALALSGVLPKLFLLAGAAFALHLVVSFKTLREGMTVDGMRRLQRRYHLIFAAIGVLLIASKLMSW